MEAVIKKFFTPSIIVTIVGWVTVMIFLFASMDAHTKDVNVHMPYKDKIKQFVTREEFEQLKKQLDRIENELQSVNEYLRSD